MSTTRKTSPEQQREELKKSQRKATKSEPQNFRDKANDDKVVEIGSQESASPIKGIDPAERGRRER